MNFKRISTRMLVRMVPVILIAMGILTVVSMQSSKAIITEQITSSMKAELRAQDGAMGEYLDSVSNMATMFANIVETDYTSTDIKTYEKMLASIISENSVVRGSGIWFEPYVYDSEEKYMGPYVYKDGENIVTTYDYSNADYDYFKQEYYMMSSSAQEAQFTNPYYDETSDTIMSTCACPMIVNGKYIGCVTVDIGLETITNLIENIKVGENGKAVLTTSEGVYLAGVDADKIQNSMNITGDNDISAVAGEEILKNDNGMTACDVKGEQKNLYYATLDRTGWKLIIEMPQSEVNAPLYRMVEILVFGVFLTVIVACAVLWIHVTAIAKKIREVQGFAGFLAEGDFTIDALEIKSRDEIGEMSISLNQMYESNRNVICNIKNHAEEIGDSSDKLKEAVTALKDKFHQMQDYMNHVNAEMISTSAATEEVNASAEEVFANVNLLAERTADSMQMAQQIRKKALEVGDDSRNAYDSATSLSGEFKERLHRSIENAKVVESIGELANVISGIAEQINLLSLNASIEAARAGEAGRGFAVVATEIGTLAGSTSEAVDQIQSTITDVKSAFDGLVKDTQALLEFVQNRVAPDYSNFVGVADQYEKDAETIDETSRQISTMSETIKNIMQEVSGAVQEIAEATQHTTELSSDIMSDIDFVSNNITDVSSMSDAQDGIVKDLNEVVAKFKLQ